MPMNVEKEASGIRLSLRELDKKCNAQKKNDFLKAWKLIQELPSTNPNSFWSIASYHGMPFKERRVPLGGGKSEKDVSGTDKDKDTKTWGGYCQHGNVLFPFWHRFYCLRLEQALQSVLEKGQERVALHYWDASSKESTSEGLPDIVTTKDVCIDGEYVPNPLLKFKLPKAIKDDVSPSGPNSQFYEKEAGYETCRYPYSGIRSPDDAKATAIEHNKKIDSRDETPQSLLQANIISWLSDGASRRKGVAQQLEDCLHTTDYNPFSNTTSVGSADVSVEQPHNDLHVAIGGFTQPETNEDGSVKQDSLGNFIWDGPIEGANGDMGANEVASYDPIFFLHHSNMDRMLWIWQKKYKKTDPEAFTIDNSDETDKGISNSDQGATPNQTWGQKLNESTILYPFQDEYGVPRTSKDCIDIVSQLGYDYSIGSLDQATWPEPVEVNTVRLMVKPSTPWTEITHKMTEEIDGISALEARRTGIPTRRKRLRMIFDRTHLIPSAVSEMQMQAAAAFRHIPICPTDPIADTFTIKGLPFKFENFVQVKDINKNKISGSFAVQVFYRAAEKLYYLGQRNVLSRWNRSTCANCQGRRMAHVSIPIRGGHTALYDPKNLEVHLVNKDGMTGKYIRKVLAGKDLVVPAAARSAPGEQEPTLSIIGAFVQD
ncbi:Tyrosinase [Acropora cervicornis]|uniref:Tyrosinase n=1 Tax=Acropora cervicornis TaxID=6130 RepID=A0AAD9USZ5_ACRCE|nr:Tyrosinase [Acropora cervicornis]